MNVHVYRTYQQSRTPGLLVDMSGYGESWWTEQAAQRDMKERETMCCPECGGTGFKNHNETTDCPECAAFGLVLVGLPSWHELNRQVMDQVEAEVTHTLEV